MIQNVEVKDLTSFIKDRFYSASSESLSFFSSSSLLRIDLVRSSAYFSFSFLLDSFFMSRTKKMPDRKDRPQTPLAMKKGVETELVES